MATKSAAPPETVLGPHWLVWTVLAFVATVFHVLIDQHLGLFGAVSSDMSVVKGLWGLFQSLLLGWWMLMAALAVGGNGVALRSCVVLTAIFAFGVNGVVAIIAAPPISDAAPWQDISHFGAAIAGFQATRTGIRQLGKQGSPKGGRLLVISVAILVATAAFALPLNLDAISS
ncbi:MAG TPA: hypothetical protein VLB67_14690 [Acidimicrobiia bacterium]|nr:hypothetical protein [Acidimicrobiia bacterium]